MAKPKAPLISFGALGSVAKTVTYAKWRGRQFARRHASPTDRKTAPQVVARNVFGTGNLIWNLMPDLAIAPWNRHAAGRVFSGQNAWQGRFMLDNHGQVDLLALTLSPGAKGGLAPASVVSTPGPELITVDFSTPAAPIGWTLQSAIAATIRDGDPETTLFHVLIAGEDAPAAAQVVLSGLTPSVPYVVGGWLRWAKPGGSIAYGPSLAVTSVTPALAYVANAVHFDGVNDWIERDADLDGNANVNKALFSFWFNMTGGDTTQLRFSESSNAGYVFIRLADNKFYVNFRNPANTLIWQFRTDEDYTTITNPGWNHFLVAFDAGASPVGQAYMNDAVLARTDLVAPTTGDVRWIAGDHGVGAMPGGTAPINADLADWYGTNEYLDISVEANRRKFINAGGKPVDLGSDGSLPTGTAPLMFFTKSTATWQDNAGSGGGFTEYGALTTAASSPSD